MRDVTPFELLEMVDNIALVTSWVATMPRSKMLDPFTTGNSPWGTKLLGFSTGRGSEALKKLMKEASKQDAENMLRMMSNLSAG